jgi:hypothetical protein
VGDVANITGKTIRVFLSLRLILGLSGMQTGYNSIFEIKSKKSLKLPDTDGVATLIGPMPAALYLCRTRRVCRP